MFTIPSTVTAAKDGATFYANMLAVGGVFPTVLSRCEYDQVFYCVIFRITIDVVNMFVTLKRASQVLFHQYSMQVLVTLGIVRVGRPKINTASFLCAGRWLYHYFHSLQGVPDSRLPNAEIFSNYSRTRSFSVFSKQPISIAKLGGCSPQRIDAQSIKRQFYGTPTTLQFMGNLKQRLGFMFSSQPLAIIELWVSRSWHTQS